MREQYELHRENGEREGGKKRGRGRDEWRMGLCGS